MAVDIPAIREIVERVFARQDVLDACKRRDLSTPITVLCANGVTQAQIAALTGIPQGRLSEYKTRKRIPAATSTFEAFADGLGLPPAARLALGLAPEAAASGRFDPAGGRSADIAGASLGDVRPLLSNLSRASAIPVLSALRGIHRGYIEADRLMGSICITGPIQPSDASRRKGLRGNQGGRPGRDAPVCQPVHGVRRVGFPGRRGSDMRDALDRQGARLRSGARGPACYRLYAHAQGNDRDGKRKSCAGLGIANSALEYKDALTPRLRAVILRQRSYSNAALGEVIASARDSDEAVIEAVAGENQGEGDRAPYCTPTYAAMEAGASWVLLGHPKTALPILEKSRSEWLDHTEVRDYALCVSRLAIAYAAAGELEQACAATGEVVALAQGLGSRRVVGQLDLLYRRLARWRQDPAVAGLRGRLKVLVDSFKPEREAG